MSDEPSTWLEVIAPRAVVDAFRERLAREAQKRGEDWIEDATDIDSHAMGAVVTRLLCEWLEQPEAPDEYYALAGKIKQALPDWETEPIWNYSEWMIELRRAHPEERRRDNYELLRNEEEWGARKAELLVKPFEPPLWDGRVETAPWRGRVILDAPTEP